MKMMYTNNAVNMNNPVPIKYRLPLVPHSNKIIKLLPTKPYAKQQSIIPNTTPKLMSCSQGLHPYNPRKKISVSTGEISTICSTLLAESVDTEIGKERSADKFLVNVSLAQYGFFV